MDDNIVREMVEGHDVGVEASKVAALSSLVSPHGRWQWMAREIIDTATQDYVCTEGYKSTVNFLMILIL